MKISTMRAHHLAVMLLIFIFACWIMLQSKGLRQENSYGFSQFEAVSHFPLASFSQTPVFIRRSISVPLDPAQATKEVHAGSLAPLGEGRLFALWYGGTREGARDVELFKTIFENGEWLEPRSFMTVAKLADATNRYIKKLGNAVAIKHSNGTLFVFFSSVSLGGWAGSAINMIKSYDDGLTFSAPTRLVTSPFNNISTLVRTAPFLFENGDIGLPIYHEFIGKFSELLRLSPTGILMFKQRISHGDHALQPSVAIHTRLHATQWQRNSDESQYRVLLSETHDGGETWSPNKLTIIPNPDSAVASLPLKIQSVDEEPKDAVLLVYNHSTQARYRLSLGYLETSGDEFTRLVDIAHDETQQGEYSYPEIRKTSPEVYDLVFTKDRKTIEHVRFNQAWLNQQLILNNLPEHAPSTQEVISFKQSDDLTALTTFNASKLAGLNIKLVFAPYLFLIFILTWLILVRCLKCLSMHSKMNLSIALIFTGLITLISFGQVSILNWFHGIFGGLSSASWVVLLVYIYQTVFLQQPNQNNKLYQLKVGFWRSIAFIGALFYPLALGWGMFDPYQFGYAFSEYFSFFIGAVVLFAVYFHKNILILTWLGLSFVLFALFPLESPNFWDYLLDPLAVIISMIALIRVKNRGVLHQ